MWTEIPFSGPIKLQPAARRRYASLASLDPISGAMTASVRIAMGGGVHPIAIGQKRNFLSNPRACHTDKNNAPTLFQFNLPLGLLKPISLFVAAHDDPLHTPKNIREADAKQLHESCIPHCGSSWTCWLHRIKERSLPVINCSGYEIHR